MKKLEYKNQYFLCRDIETLEKLVNWFKNNGILDDSNLKLENALEYIKSGLAINFQITINSLIIIDKCNLNNIIAPKDWKLLKLKSLNLKL